MTKAAVLAVALCAGVAPGAQAQMTWTDKGFVNATIGIQGGSHSLATSTSFDIYASGEFGEQASLATTQDVGGGLFFDVSGGYKVWRNLALGVGFSRTSSDADVAVAASVPDPLVADRPRAVTTTASGAAHSEVGIHLMGVWMMPVTDKVDVGFSFGPTIFQVSQDVPAAITVNEPGPTVSSTTFTSADKTTVGINIGVDVTYLVTPRIGAGMLARYTWGSADLEGASDKLTVGGFQIGAGVRIRF